MVLTKRAILGIVILAFAESLSGQATLQLRIADTTGIAVPFAVIDASPGGRRVADSVGSATFAFPSRVDSVRVVVRRIGYMPSTTMLRVGANVTEIRLTPVAGSLSAVVVTDRRNNVLMQQGFYDRVDRVRRGAFTGEFITPEDLERLSPATLSRALTESRYVRIGRAGRRQSAVLLGRGGCGYTILVDGMRVAGTHEENATGVSSINPGGTRRESERSNGIEDFVGGLEIAAIEVYPSAATAPAEIQAKAMGGRGSCGIIAIWTGRGR